MKLIPWDDVKSYPLAVEVTVYVLLLLSFAHAARTTVTIQQPRTGSGLSRWQHLSVWLSLSLVVVMWEVYWAYFDPKWHPVCYPKSLVMLRNCHSLWGFLRHIPCQYMSKILHFNFVHDLYFCLLLRILVCLLLQWPTPLGLWVDMKSTLPRLSASWRASSFSSFLYLLSALGSLITSCATVSVC